MNSGLIDSFGREHDYLRVAITDRCNLRCVYCMPIEGVEWKAHENILTFEEIIRIVKIMSGLGVRNVRVTGGEPLLRKGAPNFLNELKNISGIENVTLTTNGILLGEYLNELESAKYTLPDGINISLDALDCERYKRITRCESITPVYILPLINRLLVKQITVKINCVPVSSYNDEEIIPLTELARDKNIIVRFIELMPIGCASDLQCIPGKDVAAIIEKSFGTLVPFDGVTGNGPASYYSLTGFTGKIGFINAITHSFCDTCNRLRLTSEGFLKLCLSNDQYLDLRQLIRGGAGDNEVANIITEFVKNKPRGYKFSECREGMSKIGG
ncbi:MAG: GTP 3',8-cyclase MoaA [Treponema sp.]|nr:GTP 3',8-cyclase MoaA [Treponema sp.]